MAVKHICLDNDGENKKLQEQTERKDLENEHWFQIYSAGYTASELSDRSGVLGTCKQRESNDVSC